jgi:hypothetical protein
MDSMSFLASGLASLASNLVGENCDLTKAPRFVSKFKSLLGDEEMKRFLKKGVFPYRWFDSIDKLECDSLPPKEDFWSDLNWRAHKRRGLRASTVDVDSLWVQDFPRLS